MTNPFAGKTCCEKIPYAHGWHFRTCGAAAKTERDGKFYCKRHDPVAVQAKREARDIKWRNEYAAKMSKWDHEKRLTAAKDMVIESVRAATEQRGSWDAVSEAMDVLRREENRKET